MNEFDQLSDGYRAGFDDPLKGLIGRDAGQFLKPKIELLIENARRRFPRSQEIRLLDFGCGAGDFLVELGTMGLPWKLEGCDVSEGMLAEAQKRHATRLQTTRIWNSSEAPLPSRSYEIVTAVCVFHHIAPDSWLETLRAIKASLVEGGLCLIFEHNPLNPVTRWMVSRTEVDKNAHLLTPARARDLFEQAGFTRIWTEHFLFFPPRLRFLAPLEALLRPVPLGGQYLLTGEMPTTPGKKMPTTPSSPPTPAIE